MTNLDEPDASLAPHARELLETNRYLTLGTVSPDGRPWTSPVYFSWSAEGGMWEFYWVSSADARHSLNLLDRPAVSISVFDSTVPAYHGRAVYAVGEAREVPLEDLDEALSHYPGPPWRGGSALTRSDVTGDEPWRFYQAGAAELWVLCPREPRRACPLHGLTVDHRARVL